MGTMRKTRGRMERGTQTILLVDDEEVLRQLVKTVVASRGYKVLTAKDGEQAMRIFSRSHSNIDLVLSDIVLPKLGGDRLLKKMQKIDPKVRVIFSSGYLQPDLKLELRKAGASGFIQKPQHTAEILAKIRHALK